MKVVVDTNVLVSAILKDKDPEAVILFISGASDIEWIVSPLILKEEALAKVSNCHPEPVEGYL